MPEAGRDTQTQRLDKWLWHARVVKTRSIAAALVQAGKVRVNREKAVKASYTVNLGDVITIAVSGRVRVLRVASLAERRGPAAEAQELYSDLTPREDKPGGPSADDPSAP
jgi:ribosome-associated heat shock protein Hsp15